MFKYALLSFSIFFISSTVIAADIYGKWTVPIGQIKIIRDDLGSIFLKIDNKGKCLANYELTYGPNIISNDPKAPESYTNKEVHFSMGQTALAHVSCDFITKKL